MKKKVVGRKKKATKKLGLGGLGAKKGKKKLTKKVLKKTKLKKKG